MNATKFLPKKTEVFLMKKTVIITEKITCRSIPSKEEIQKIFRGKAERKGRELKECSIKTDTVSANTGVTVFSVTGYFE